MAGDWIKIELELPDKPEVHAIAACLSMDSDLVVGKLFRVWQWFDKHTVDGNAFGVTFALVDRISGVTGFGEAMAFAGWLEQKDKFLCMPGFDKHTSQSAKKRALTGRRVKKSRNADSVTQALPREEKRRSKKQTSEYSEEFLKFWEAYPSCERKGGRPDAYKAWLDKSCEGHIEIIVQHVIATIIPRDPSYIPAPSAYLRKQGWDGWDGIHAGALGASEMDGVV